MNEDIISGMAMCLCRTLGDAPLFLDLPECLCARERDSSCCGGTCGKLVNVLVILAAKCVSTVSINCVWTYGALL